MLCLLKNQHVKESVKVTAFPARCVCVCVRARVSYLVVSNTLQLHGLEPARLLCPWNSPGKNIGVGCHFLLQGIFPTQGSNPAIRLGQKTENGSVHLCVNYYLLSTQALCFALRALQTLSHSVLALTLCDRC